MVDSQTVSHESAAVHSHLQMMQGVIQRMAENSRSCKIWAVTLVSAILVLVAGTADAAHALIALAPVVLFFVLDAYYLWLEQGFRDSYDDFLRDLHDGTVRPSDLYSVARGGSGPAGFLRAMFGSVSVLPFYAVLVATVLLAWWLIL